MKAQERQVKNTLQKLAMRLPFNYVENPCSVKMKGSEILSHNKQAKDQDGTEIDPKKDYFINTTQRMPVNHYKRLKRIHREKGWQGVEDYCKGVIQLEVETMTPVSIGGIQTQYD